MTYDNIQLIFDIAQRETAQKWSVTIINHGFFKNAVPAKSMVFCLWWCLSVGKVRLVAWKTWSPVASLPGHLRRKNDIYDGPQWTCCISCGSSRRQWQATPARIKPRWAGAGWWLHSGVRPHFGCSLIILLSYNFKLSYIEKQRATDFPPWNWASRSDQTVLCHPCAVAMHHVLPELNVVSGNFNTPLTALA